MIYKNKVKMPKTQQEKIIYARNYYLEHRAEINKKIKARYHTVEHHDQLNKSSRNRYYFIKECRRLSGIDEREFCN